MYIVKVLRDIFTYCTDPASKKANPHCMKNIIMAITTRKNLSFSLSRFSTVFSKFIIFSERILSFSSVLLLILTLSKI